MKRTLARLMSGCGCQCGGGCDDCNSSSGAAYRSDGLSGRPYYRPGVRGLGRAYYRPGIPRRLGAIDAAAAAAQVIGSDSHVNASSRSAILASAGAGVMLDASGSPAYIPGTADCAAVSSSGSNNLNLVQAGAGLALTGVQVGLTTAGISMPLIAPVTIAISSIIGLFSMISAHHAAAVKKEQDVLCTAVPAANNYLSIIEQAVQSGAASPQDGQTALDSLYSDFQSEVGSIRNDCNAACVMGMELAAIVALKKSEYQDLITGAQQTVPPSRPQVSSPAGVSAPASTYTPFYSGGSGSPSPAPTVPASTSTMPSYGLPATPAAAAAGSPSPGWLPIAAIVIGGIFLLRGI